MAVEKRKRVLVTGGATPLGMNIAAALLAEGAEVTLLVRPGTENRLGPLAARVRWYPADVWDPASLRGRARGHGIVINTVGSLTADPSQGLTYHRLNVISARNIANMCISDGVSHMVLLSAVSAPWINRHYVSAKREAESYVRRVGLSVSIIRAPLTYIRSESRPIFYRLMSVLGVVPPISWLGFNRIAPLSLDVLARGVARISLDAPPRQRSAIYYAPDLRRRNKRDELRNPLLVTQESSSGPVTRVELPEDEVPFGWMPTQRKPGDRR